MDLVKVRAVTVAAVLLLAALPVPASAAVQQSATVIETVAGTGDPPRWTDDPTETKITRPAAITTAPDGTVYFFDDLQLYTISSHAGALRVVAGTGAWGFSGDGGPATSATFGSQDSGTDDLDLTTGPDGKLYVADPGNNRVRTIDPATGIISTFAGNGTADRFSGDGDRATEASLNGPEDVAVAKDGTVYIADRGNYRVRAVDPATGTIRTVAGTSVPGGGNRATETFFDPSAITIGQDGKLYVAETGKHRILAIDVANDTVQPMAVLGTPSNDQFELPTDIAAAPDGKLYLTATSSSIRDSEPVLFAVDPASGAAHHVAGRAVQRHVEETRPFGDGGDPKQARLVAGGVATAADGTVYLSDRAGIRIRAVTNRPLTRSHAAAARPITTVAGSGRAMDGNARSELKEAEEGALYRDVHERFGVDLVNPTDVAVDADGTLYVTDTENYRIRSVNPGDGTVRTVAGTIETPLYDLHGLTLGPDRTLYFLASLPSLGKAVHALDLKTGVLRTVSADGLTKPQAIAVRPDGTLFVAGDDVGVCALPPGEAACRPLDEPHSEREYLSLTDLAVGPDGTLLGTDSDGVLAIDPHTGKTRRIAGFKSKRPPDFRTTGDGVLATSAVFGYPSGLAVSADGVLYVSDAQVHRVRAITLATGVIQAVSGTEPPLEHITGQRATRYPGGAFSGDQGPAELALLDNPGGLTIGPGGVLYVADSGNNRIRAIGDVATPTSLVVQPVVYVWGGAAVLLAAAALAGGWYWRKYRGTKQNLGTLNPGDATDR